MPIREFHTGTGLVLDMRPMEGEELIEAGERARRKETIAATCEPAFRCARVVSRGLYRTLGEGEPLTRWRDLLVGDGLLGLAYLRELSIPGGETIDAPPQRCPECNAKNQPAFRLSQLEVKTLSEEAKTKLEAGDNSFTYRFDDDAPTAPLRITYALPTLGDTEALTHLWETINKKRTAQKEPPRTRLSLVESMAVTLRAVNDTRFANTYMAWEFARKAGMPKLLTIQGEQNERTCGIDTDGEILCIACKEPMAVQVPLAATSNILAQTRLPPGTARVFSSKSSYKDTSSSPSTSSSGGPTEPAT